MNNNSDGRTIFEHVEEGKLPEDWNEDEINDLDTLRGVMNLRWVLRSQTLTKLYRGVFETDFSS